METETTIRQTQIERCHEVVKENITGLKSTLYFAIGVIEGGRNEAELAGDRRFCALCSLYEKLSQVEELFKD